AWKELARYPPRLGASWYRATIPLPAEIARVESWLREHSVMSWVSLRHGYIQSPALGADQTCETRRSKMSFVQEAESRCTRKAFITVTRCPYSIFRNAISGSA